MNTYIAYHFTIEPKELGSEILIAQLQETAFESFEETENGIIAYCQKKLWEPNILEDVYIIQNEGFKISYSIEEIEQVNWNEEWEKNFNPIYVNDTCTIRAPFHEKSLAKYDIIIEPKMSFGTGHHETTYMMIELMLKTDFSNKKVLDMGCGTAVLAIFAELKGAKNIDAIDIDNWCYLNSLENVERNQCKNILVYEGDASVLKNKSYDIIIANINRNILLQDISAYATSLSNNGLLFLSGFYTEDKEILNQKCNENALYFVESISKNNWMAMIYKKNN